MNMPLLPFRVVWVWVVCVISIALTAFVWLIFTWPVTMIIDTVEQGEGWPPEASTTIAFLRTIFMVIPILLILGLLLWAYVNSQRRETVTYPYD